MMNWLARRKNDYGRLFASIAYYEAPVASSISRFMRLTLQDKYSPDEIFMLGLLDPKKKKRELQQNFSNEQLLRLQRQINPPGSGRVTSDKLAFEARCADCGLPTPAILCIFSKLPAQNSTKAPWISNDSDWCNFYESVAAKSIVIKPVAGAHGNGVLVLNPSTNGHVSADGKSYGANEAIAHMRSLDYDTWIVQPRLISHPILTHLASTEYIQTIRIVTYIDSDNAVTILGCRLRIIVGHAGTDNFDFGRSGNLIASVDPQSGCIQNVLTGRKNAPGLEYVTHHPVSGQALIGFEIPLWHDVINLTQQAARGFLPLRTVGWDIAITDGGVSLIEGNEFWDSRFYEHDQKSELELLHQCGAKDGLL